MIDPAVASPNMGLGEEQLDVQCSVLRALAQSAAYLNLGIYVSEGCLKPLGRSEAGRWWS